MIMLRHQEVGNTDFCKSEKTTSRSHKTDSNNTEMSYTDIQSINQSDAGLQNFSPGVAPSV